MVIGSDNTLHGSINSRKVINDSLSNYFILEFKLECLKQALETMIDKSRIKMELKPLRGNENSCLVLFTVIISNFVIIIILLQKYYDN